MKLKIISTVFLLLFALGTTAYAGAECVINEDGTVIHSENANRRLPMASTTKVMTALVVMESLPLDLTVTVSKYCTAVEGSSMYLKPGDVYSVRDLLYGMMLVSGNDAALTLAVASAGNQESFCTLMNEKAEEMGLKNTHFTNPHGLHDSNHYTSAYDLAVICKTAMENPVFCEIAGALTAEVTELSDNKTTRIHNKNKLLTNYPYADGIKIGYTRAAGRCLCASAVKNGKRLICVLLDKSDWFKRAEILFENAF